MSDDGPGVIGAARDRVEQAAGGSARLQIILILAAAIGFDGFDKAMISAVAGEIEKTFKVGHTDIGLLIAASPFGLLAMTQPAVIASRAGAWRSRDEDLPVAAGSPRRPSGSSR